MVLPQQLDYNVVQFDTEMSALGSMERSCAAPPRSDQATLHTRLAQHLGELNFTDADERRAFPPTLHGILVRHGTFGLCAPSSYGGLALPLREAARVIRTVASFDISAASALVIHNLLAMPCIQGASHIPDYAAVLRGAVLGDLCAFALTESKAGSAPQHIGSTAFMDGKVVRISGRKIWIGLADWARWIVCVAKATGPVAEGRLVTVLVDRQTPGVTIAHEHKTLGLRGIIQNTVDLDGVEVPDSCVLSRRSDGWTAAAGSMNLGRIGVAAMGLGAMERAIQVAAIYARNRRIAGELMIDNSHVEQALERMLLRRNVVSAVLDACLSSVSSSGAPDPYLASAAKVLSSEWCGLVVDRCVQMLGGRGYDEATPLAKIYRDARILRIFEGPTEALVAHLGRSLLSRATSSKIETLFASLNASSVHASAVEALEGLDLKDGSVLVHAGWLVVLGLAVAAVASSQIVPSDHAEACARFAASEFAACRSATPAIWSRVDRSRATYMLENFLEDMVQSIRFPVLSNNLQSVEGYV